MRFLLSFLPFSKREADHAAERISDVMADLSWAEIIQTTLLTAMCMIMIPAMLLVFAAPEAWV